MNLQQFKDKWNGKACEVAGSANAKNQCVDLANAYIRDVLGLKIIEWTNACDFPSKAGSNFDYIKNTPTGVPEKGDLVVWSSNVGNGAGHIAIFIEGTANSFTSFDQNWSLKELCKIENHKYNNVVGWLHPKENMNDDEMVIKKSVFEQLVGKATERDQYHALAYGTPADIKQLIEDLSRSIKDKDELRKIAEGKFDDLQAEHKNLLSDICAEDALNCTQDYSTIKAEARKTGKYKADAEDLARNFAIYKGESEKTHGELEVEIARLKALLQQQNVLENIELAELLRELVRRLSLLLKRK